MKLFTSRRERRLWLWVLLVVAAIYSTLGTAGTLAEELRRRDLFDGAFAVAFFLLVAVIVVSAVDRRPGRREIWVLLGVVAVYSMVLTRIGIPEERTHLFEYGLVGILVYQALAERLRERGSAWAPAVLAIVITALLGLIDEGIQAALPNRYFAMRDVGFNVLAGFMAVASTLALRWAQRRTTGKSAD